MHKISILPLLASAMLYANTTLYVGKTYDFAESDMIEAIQDHIHNNQNMIQQKYEDMRKKANERVDNLSPNLTKKPTPAIENRTYYANTIYTNTMDIKDANGKVIYRKGYSFDRMDYIQLPYSLVIINAERKEEIEWLKKSGMLNSAAYKILITEGKLRETNEKLGQAVFFASDKIISELNIVVTPTIATQERNKLRMMEVCVACNKDE